MRSLILKSVAIAVASNGSKFLSVKANYASRNDGSNALGEEVQFSLPGSKDLIEVLNNVNPFRLSPTQGLLLIRGTEAQRKGVAIPGTGLLALNCERGEGLAVESIEPISEVGSTFVDAKGEIVPFVKFTFTRGTEEVSI